ncbi:hypothetical protein ASA1KI_22870 [Opitutales bacterium ASA1]|uniref:hypothetical protein n=1 Tax=Congregicoccus parvus TaxID=3081749 RepID=UPI002B289FD8|nr:hypothetical protein ASA1KI_22870 [Opitutales bacterium ASA1]
MNTQEDSVPPLPTPASIAPDSLVDFALRDLTRPAPPPTPPTDLVEHLPDAELHTVLDQIAQLDPLGDFQHRERAARHLAEAQAAASGVPPPLPAKSSATAKGTAHAPAKAHQPAQKWVTRRFA